MAGLLSYIDEDLLYQVEGKILRIYLTIRIGYRHD